MVNEDLLEVAEYFVQEQGECRPERYRYQWMEGRTGKLRRRWDNVGHYPELPNFPYHVHLEDGEVIPGESMGIIQLLEVLIGEIGHNR
ncbi:MAG: DUF6516 family protein [Anaerolineae bacterium]|nr:DUF6516 family protein [Anaerolineae bacterium]